MTPPYITAWGSELGYVVRPEPLLKGALALFCHTGKAGEGAPVWGRISEERQRRCAVLQLCQICGESLAGVGYAIAISLPGEDLATLPLRGHEPMVCTRCLPRSFYCPRIRQAYVEQALVIVAVRAFGLVPHRVGIHPDPVEEADIAVNQALVAAGLESAIDFVELLVESGTAFPGQMLAELARLAR